MPKDVPRSRPPIPSPVPTPSIPSEISFSIPSSSDIKHISHPSKLIPSAPALPSTFRETLSFVKAKPHRKPNVGKLLSGLESEMQFWIASLKENCSESQNPYEPKQLFSQFKRRFNVVASTIQDICCKDALDNLFKAIYKRIQYLKDVPEHESYTAFAERCAAAKAAER